MINTTESFWFFEKTPSQCSNSRDLTFSSKVGETREFLQAQQHVPSATAANFPIKVLAGTILWHYLPRKHLPRSPRLLLADVGLLGSTGALWFIMKNMGYDNMWYLLYMALEKKYKLFLESFFISTVFAMFYKSFS